MAPHRLCSINGQSMYGIRGTENVGQAVDEIELNARKIEQITHRKPVFYRSATATTDEACGEIAKVLGERIIGYDVLSGDAIAELREVKKQYCRKSAAGCDCYHAHEPPEWNGYEALREAIPRLREMGYSFVNFRIVP